MITDQDLARNHGMKCSTQNTLDEMTKIDQFNANDFPLYRVEKAASEQRRKKRVKNCLLFITATLAIAGIVWAFGGLLEYFFGIPS